MAIEIVTYNLWYFVFFLSWNGRFHPSTVCYATWRRRRSTSSSISIRTSTPLFRRRTRSTTNSECSTGSRSGREPTPTPGTQQNKLNQIKISIFSSNRLSLLIKMIRYPNGNGAGLGLTTGVGAGSPPYTPLPGATSPDQTPLCHQISSNDGSYNHKKGKHFFFFFV